MKGHVTVPLLNVRIRPGGRIVGRLKEHEQVNVFEIDGDWAEVEYHGVPRQVMTKYIFLNDKYKKQYTATVNVARLNIRSKPNGTKLGMVKRGDILYIIDEVNDWIKVSYLGNEAWVMKRYTDTEELKYEEDPLDEIDDIFADDEVADMNAVKMTGKVTTNILNVRNSPDGDIIGKLHRNDLVNVISEAGSWYKFIYKNQIAYTSSKYVLPLQGTTTASTLNVRNKPDGSVIGKLPRGSKVNIIENKNGWIKFIYEKQTAYISADYVRLHSSNNRPSGGGDSVIPHNVRENFFHQREDLRKLKLEPASKLDVEGSKYQKLGSSIYNQYGNLLQVFSKELKIDIACAVAVLCVESGGRGFSSDGRMLIRFENHLFYNFWGKNNESVFDKHFKFNSAKRWMGHQYRTRSSGHWTNLHSINAQEHEWKALEFARSLDDSRALYSISMGAPQVMGFNHRIIGYDSVQEMFKKFNEGIYYHICALFDFCMDRPVRIKYLQNKDFVEFAREYNGPGQPHKYGAWMKEYYRAFPLK